MSPNIHMIHSHTPKNIFSSPFLHYYFNHLNKLIYSQLMEPKSQLSFLQCYICLEAHKKPKMCPSCSKVACDKCLRQWIEDHHQSCPHCRQPIPFENFAQCERFINDIRHLVKALDKDDVKNQKCGEHKMQLQYYCEDCEVAICSDCGMFGTKHKGHKINRLGKIYQNHKNKILNELGKFDKKIEGFRKSNYQMRLEMQKLHLSMEQKKNNIEEYFVTVLEKLTEEMKEREEIITEKFDKNKKQIEFLESVRENISQELQGHTEAELIQKCEQFITYIQVLCDKNPEYSFQDRSFDVIHEMVPHYNTFSCKLLNFTTLTDPIVYSEGHEFNGIQWRLKIYPKGNGAAKQTHLSVFLQMSKGYENENKYEYKIELVHSRLVKDSIVREYSSNFDIGECWGYNQFVLLSDIEDNFLWDDDSLNFNVSVRNPSYRSFVRDQNNYIENLEKKLNQSEKNKQKNKLKRVKSVKKMKNLREKKQKGQEQKMERKGKDGEIEVESDIDLVRERKDEEFVDLVQVEGSELEGKWNLPKNIQFRFQPQVQKQ